MKEKLTNNLAIKLIALRRHFRWATGWYSFS